MSTQFVSQKMVVRFALLIAAGVAAACLWSAWCEFPIYMWNEMRLAPTFGLRHGINPYPPLDGGPLSTWIYGPVAILVNLPATFAATPAGALQIAGFLNQATLLLPLAVIFFGSAELRIRYRGLPWLALALGALLIPRTGLMLQVADHTAILFGLLSCWCLARPTFPSNPRLVVVALLCALAVWSKQIAIFIIPAQILFLLLNRARSAVIPYLLWTGCFGLVTFFLTGWIFGFRNLWLNVVLIPARLPWVRDFPERVTMRTWPLFAQIVLPLLGLALLRILRFWPSRTGESVRFFQLTVLVYVTMLPVGLVAFFKAGGDINLLHSWSYLLPGALLAWLVADGVSCFAPARLLGVTLLIAGLHWTDLVSLPIRSYTQHFATAQELTAVYPHAIWFPRNPLITFYADGELWHCEDGIEIRFLANYGLRESDFRRHLPRNLQAIVYPSVVQLPFVLPLLSEFNQTSRVPYWTLHTRTPRPSVQ